MILQDRNVQIRYFPDQMKVRRKTAPVLNVVTVLKGDADMNKMISLKNAFGTGSVFFRLRAGFKELCFVKTSEYNRMRRQKLCGI